MLADLMRATQKVPGFHRALDLHLVETSPVLRAVQQAAIHHPRTYWHEAVEDVPQDGYRLVLANEFLDTLPIRQLQWWSGRWHDRLVGLDEEGSFVFVADPRPSALASASGTWPNDVVDGAVMEFAPAREAFIAQLSDGLAACGGSALLIDYGDTDLAPGDSLQAVRQHARVDPLSAPGEADLTSRVIFAPLLDVARSRGVEVWGPVGQGEFLKRIGLDARLRQLCGRANPTQAASLRRGAERLASGEGMGELFKVVALTTEVHGLPGFGADERWQGCG